MILGEYGIIGGFMWIFWIVLIVGIVLLIKWIMQQNRPVESRPEENSLEILKTRYAKGEIDKQEFEQKKYDLLS